MLRTFIITRQLSRKAGMPGLNKLSKEFKNDIGNIVDDPEGFGDLESDFFDVHKTHKQHERELKQRREQVRHFIVGNKYFKSKQPNFLTYAEKEQIRLLHSRDSEEWSAVKLAESFPATPDIIARIIKAKWLANSPQRVELHDKTVIKNWEIFSKGEFTQLDSALKEHLHKFAKRTAKDLKNLVTTVRPKPDLPKPSRTEFASIITESMKFRKSAQTNEADSQDGSSLEQISAASGENPFIAPSKNASKSKPSFGQPPLPRLDPTTMEDETYLLDKLNNKKPMRFQDLVRKNPEIQQNIKEVALNRVENPQGTGVVMSTTTRNNPFTAVDKFNGNEVEISHRDLLNTSGFIREKIRIPRKLWQKGSTYKLNDCYYDVDGEFLYRVPGMTGRNEK